MSMVRRHSNLLSSMENWWTQEHHGAWRLVVYITGNLLGKKPCTASGVRSNALSARKRGLTVYFWKSTFRWYGIWWISRKIPRSLLYKNLYGQRTQVFCSLIPSIWLTQTRCSSCYQRAYQEHACRCRSSPDRHESGPSGLLLPVTSTSLPS